MRVFTTFGIAASILGLFWLTYARGGVNWANQFLYFQGSDPATAGQWGDAFGGFNALVGALGFAGVLATIFLQNQSLKEQQVDQHRQRFDTTFFQLLTLLRDVREEISEQDFGADGAIEQVSGSRALRAMERHLLDNLRRVLPIVGSVDRKDVVVVYEDFHRNREHMLGPYFRLIYNILKRIDEEKVLTKDEKIRYGNLLRGQLGSHETGLLMLNGLSSIAKDLPLYLNKYRMPRYLPENQIKRAVFPFYESEAFEPRDD